MSDKSEPDAIIPEAASQWADLWQSFVESSRQMTDAWSSSMAPFMLSRLLEHPAGFALGNEMSEAIEKMAQGPKLAEDAMKQTRLLVNNPREVTFDDALAIYTEAFGNRAAA